MTFTGGKLRGWIMKNLLLVGLVPVVLAGAAVAEDANAFRIPDWASAVDLEKERLELYRQHMQCTSAAVERMLNSDEAAACSRVFLKLKLSFLPGSDISRFETLSPATRAMGNEKGYNAYRAWLHRRIVMAPLDAGQKHTENTE